MNIENLILGCQTFGSSLKEKDCITALNLCLEKGVNKFDLAESYPFPEKDKTFGNSEKIFGKWLELNNNQRKKITVSTKLVGRNNNRFKSVSSDRVTKERIIKSLENSLKRLKTDYIDIYYLHWPDRYTNIFGRKYYNPDYDPIFVPIEDQFEAFYELKKSGKILNFGICNETSWGIMKFLEFSKRKKFLPILQEEYSLINRDIESSIKEIVLREKLVLNTYSPLSGGLLTGKYLFKNNPHWRLNKHKNKTKRSQTIEKKRITKRIFQFCKKNKIKMNDLALGFIKKQNFISNIIFGISSISNLENFLESWNFTIDDKTYKEILEIVK